jgi:succinate dehydrogenase / fumarate reductase, iron-sulfur subunit
MNHKTICFVIRRQSTPHAEPFWEEFDLRWRPGMNVISGLMDIAMNPVDRTGKTTTPIAYDSNCLEEVCGSCAMRINGKAAMACSSLVDKLKQPVRLEPLSRFPVIRDLAVDRSVLFENLKRVKAWVPIDGIWVRARESPRRHKSRHIPCRGACPAVCAWKSVRNSRWLPGL